MIYLGKNNPKRFWHALQARKKQFENNIIANQWFDYAMKLYEKELEVEPPPRINTSTKLFRVQEVEVGIKKLKTGKTKGLVALQTEYLKWGMNILAPHIMENSTTSLSKGSQGIGQLV